MDENTLLNNKLKMLIKEKKYEDAEGLLEFIMCIDRNSIVLNILGLLNYRRGFYKKSQEYFIESYSLNSNKDAHYYLDVLFENNNLFEKYYSALQICKDKRYEEAKNILKQIFNIKQSRIIYFTAAYLSGSLHERRRILRNLRKIIFKDGHTVKIYELMKMNYKSRVILVFMWFIAIIVAFLAAALLFIY